MVFERLVIALALPGLAALVWVTRTRLATRRLAVQAPTDPLLAQLPAGLPAIVYFSTPHCAPCRTQQRPALDQLLEEWGQAVRVIQVDAIAEPAVADRWGVFSAPTTIVLDRDRIPRHVNRGVALVETLRHQLASVHQAPARMGIDPDGEAPGLGNRRGTR